MRPTVSIVIPARDDAAALARSLDHLEAHGLTAPPAEVIVAAAGDRAEVECVVRGRARLLWPRGSTRACLMNAGAAATTGDALFFLHADSFAPPAALTLIRRALEDERVVGGAFEHRFAETDRRLRLISWVNRVRYRFTGNYYGDQGLFVRSDLFRHLGGYRDLALLEDLCLSQRLKRAGRYVLVPEPLPTSGRRFLGRGPWRTCALIGWILLLHTLGLPVEQRHAERWRGPPGLPPGSPWLRRRRADPGSPAGGLRAQGEMSGMWRDRWQTAWARFHRRVGAEARPFPRA